MSPVPIGFVFVIVLAGLLLHLNKIDLSQM